jgi:parallel beta-helix repeat protein
LAVLGNEAAKSAVGGVGQAIADLRPVLEAARDNANNAATSANTAADNANQAADNANQAAGTVLTNWLSPVSSQSVISTTYQSPVLGDTVQVLDTGYIYRYDGTQWIYTQGYSANALADLQNNKVDKTQYQTDQNSINSSLAEMLTLATKFGAIGDGTTINTNTLQQAIDDATSKRQKLWLPNGIFLTGKLNLTCDLVGVGTLKFLNTGSVYDCLTITTSGITVNDITLDGNRQSTGSGYNDYIGTCGIYITADDVNIFNIKIKNTFTMAIYADACNRLTVAYCDIRDIKGNYGDGIFQTNCTDSRILFNKVQDYTRIGIVSEGSSTVKSQNIMIIGNWIFNGHDASILTGGGEYNAGIWCENTMGTTIEDNTIKQQTHYGINVVPFVNDNKVHKNTIKDNKIYDCNTCMNLDGDIYSNFTVDNNSFHGVYTVGYYLAGTGFDNLSILNGYFGDTTLSNAIHALIKIEATSFSALSNIQIKGCKKGTITITAGNEIMMYQQPANVNLTIEDMIGRWAFQDWNNTSYVGFLKVRNTDLKLNGRASSFQSGSKFINCDIQLTAGISFQDVAFATFENCHLYPDDLTQFREFDLNGNMTKNIFHNCFIEHIRLMILNNASSTQTWLKEMEWNDYDQYGAILSNNGQLYIYEVRFYTAGNVVPISAYTSNPSRIELRNVFSKFSNPLGSPLAAHVSSGVVQMTV